MPQVEKLEGHHRGRASSGGREGWKVWGLVGLVTLVGFLVAFQFVEPAPPRSIVLATGSEGGAYQGYGEAYAAALESYGIGVELRASAGSVENVELLRSGGADVAFVQGGMVPPEAADEVKGIASLYFEPVWIFHRIDLDISRLTDLAGLRIQVGVEGSGTRAVATALLGVNGIDARNATFVGLPTDEAVGELQDGRLDAAFLVIAPGSQAIARLMEVEGESIRLLDVDRHLGYVRTFPYLAQLVLAEGVLGFERDVPDRELDLVAPTATLVAREDLHPALIPLFIQAAERIHGGGDIFSAPGVFPSPENLGVPLAESARRYFAYGQSFLYRVLPFQLAAALDRLKIMLLPLLTLLLPLFRFAPPLYQWRIRSQIYRWYKALEKVERRRLEEGSGGAGDPERLAELEEVDREIRERVNVPASYMEELYNLRMHLSRLREELARSVAGRAPGPPA